MPSVWSACRATPPVSESRGLAGHQRGRPGLLGCPGRKAMLGIEHVLTARGGADWPFHVPVPGRGNVGLQPSIAQSREAAQWGRVL